MGDIWNRLVPRPRNVEPRPGTVRIGQRLALELAPGTLLPPGLVARVNAALARLLGPGAPTLEPSPGAGAEAAGPPLRLERRPELGEGYELNIGAEAVDLVYAADPAEGLATLAQALMLADGAPLPAARVSDQAASRWRGFMLDVARHFHPAESLDRVADYLWLLRLNRFHLHLTDDQGWRFPVEGYPRLTEVGAWRPLGTSDGGVIGGFYQADELGRFDRDCALLGITVVPELDLPGHSCAALAAYPSLACTPWTGGVETRWGVFPAVVCADSADVVAFVDRVFATLADMFAGPFLHLGGDEVPPEPWRACPRCSAMRSPYQTVVRRLAETALSLGRRPLVWDEAAGLDLPGETIVVNWRGPEHAAAALGRGHDLVVSPEGRAAYLDHKHLDSPLEPGRLGVCTVADSAAFAPAPYVEAHAPGASGVRGRILGGQGNLWSEAIRNHRDIEYMAFIRLAALAEGFWSGRPAAEADDFPSRLESLRQSLRRSGMAVFPGPLSDGTI